MPGREIVIAVKLLGTFGTNDIKIFILNCLYKLTIILNIFLEFELILFLKFYNHQKPNIFYII